MHVAILGTYPPTRCGIATFTADVESALLVNETEVTVIPVDPAADTRDDRFVIHRDDPASYVAAAEHINELGCDVALVQHEFGIFGGVAGAHVLRFVEALRIPFVVTLHTVLPRFSDDETAVIQELCRRAAAVTVFTSTARRLILEQELAPARLLQVVAHGAPPELYADRDEAAARRRLGIPEDVPVMSTFGLLSEGKGIELALQAMSLLRDEHPNLHYVIAGRTHPEIVKRDGERYRHCLLALARDLDLADRVIFLDRFLDVGDLADLLGISAVVCTPYRGEAQSVSGVLTFALAAGCAVASTPYRYARDVLADGAGILADFGDDEGLADAIHTLLGPGGARARAAARQASAAMAWPTVGAALRSVLSTAIRGPVLAGTGEQPATESPLLGVPSVAPGALHLRVLCDDTAIFQHAHHNVPRVEDGYCVDDAARLVPIAARLAETTGDEAWTITLARLLAFLRGAALDGRGRMRNFMSWDRRWLDEPHHGDHVGRTIWGLGELIAINGPFTAEARELMDTLVPAISPSWPTRMLAYAGLGVAAATPVDPAHGVALSRIGTLMRDWTPTPDPAWRWFEPRLTYDNARIPEALLRVGRQLGDEVLVENGADLLHWYDALCRRGSYYRFPGHRGLSDVEQLNWSGDEQPLEAAAMADAHAAWLDITGDHAAIQAIERAWTWFLGNNRLGVAVADLATGAGYDGLGARDVNKNCGAESTIAFQRCMLTRTASRPAYGLAPAGSDELVIDA